MPKWLWKFLCRLTGTPSPNGCEPKTVKKVLRELHESSTGVVKEAQVYKLRRALKEEV